MDTPLPTHKYGQKANIKWYRTKVDKKIMSELMKQSDYEGFKQVFLQIGLWTLTGTAAYYVFSHIHVHNWYWTLPLLLVTLFLHGSQGPFMGLIAVHELCHKTPFKTKAINEFFLKVYAFISWSDHIWFRPSHVKHHQVTVHKDYDGEVVLPQYFDFKPKNWQFWISLFAWNPYTPYYMIKGTWNRARGIVDGEWNQHVLPEEDKELRRQYRNWGRTVLIGHLLLAVTFVATGHWFLIVLFTFGTTYCTWLGFLCGAPQHYGMSPDTPDFRLCCRTYTCGWLPALLYWNMQYHVEHHMYPGVPFYNLPKLRQAMIHDLPPAPHGLYATWQHMLEIHRKLQTDPKYCYVPPLPKSEGDRTEDEVLEKEAALALA